jgi:hypothetical protein
MKKCVLCKEEKDLSDFPKKDKVKYRGKCKICFNKKKSISHKISGKERIKTENIDKSILLDKRNEKERLKKIELLEKKKIREKKLCNICGDDNEINFYRHSKSKCKKCVLSISKGSYNSLTNDDKKRYVETQKMWISNNILHFRVESAKHRSLKDGISFELTDDIIKEKILQQGGVCYISKQPLSYQQNNWNTLSLDRLDSNLGYTIENTVVVTKFVNISKNNLPLDEYLKMIRLVCDNI